MGVVNEDPTESFHILYDSPCQLFLRSLTIAGDYGGHFGKLRAMRKQMRVIVSKANLEL